MKLVQQYFSQSPPRALFHYTSADALFNIVSSQTMWSTHVQYLNDSQEFHHGMQMIKDRLIAKVSKTNPASEMSMLFDALSDKLSSMQAAAYIISFSAVPDSLSQWRGYCPSGGYSLVFDGRRLAELCEGPHHNFVKCCYHRDEQEMLINDFVEELWSDYQAFRQNVLPSWMLTGRYFDSPRHFVDTTASFWARLIACALKHPAFAEEEEWRLVISEPSAPFVRPRGSLLIPHSKFQIGNPDSHENSHADAIRGVIIGPHTSPQLAALGIETFANSIGRRNFHFTNSMAPYRPL